MTLIDKAFYAFSNVLLLNGAQPSVEIDISGVVTDLHMSLDSTSKTACMDFCLAQVLSVRKCHGMGGKRYFVCG